jgi:dephospho-CoA kinase
MITIGLTGGIASGKTLVGKMFEKLGAYFIDADSIAREVVFPLSEGWQRVVQHFGQQILSKSNEIDRKKLGDIVFSDHTLREKLNDILHPFIIKRINERIREIGEKDSAAIIVVEVPLLIECDLQNDFDKIIVVWATHEAQIQRLKERNGLPGKDAQKRVRAQISLNEKRNFADYIIENVENDKTAQGTATLVKKVYLSLKRNQEQKRIQNSLK